MSCDILDVAIDKSGSPCIYEQSRNLAADDTHDIAHSSIAQIEYIAANDVLLPAGPTGEVVHASFENYCAVQMNIANFKLLRTMMTC